MKKKMTTRKIRNRRRASLELFFSFSSFWLDAVPLEFASGKECAASRMKKKKLRMREESQLNLTRKSLRKKSRARTLTRDTPRSPLSQLSRSLTTRLDLNYSKESPMNLLKSSLSYISSDS
jgi:hypothetical protein